MGDISKCFELPNNNTEWAFCLKKGDNKTPFFKHGADLNNLNITFHNCIMPWKTTNKAIFFIF